MRFGILLVMNIKTAVFWDVMMCSLVDGTNVSEEAAASIFRIFEVDSEYGGRRFIRNIGDHLQTTRCHIKYNCSPKPYTCIPTSLL
jgi:hypothetical protein